MRGTPPNPVQVDDIQFKRIMAYIEKGKEEGANCLTGGTRIGDKGYFVAPTVFGDVTDNMTIARVGQHGDSFGASFLGDSFGYTSYNGQCRANSPPPPYFLPLPSSSF